MGQAIALGFHTCVDYEILADAKLIEKQILAFDIRAEELVHLTEMDTERELWLSVLAHLRDGIGTEIVPRDAGICESFASHFPYKIALGGTATRAAIALAQLGYGSVIQTSCNNAHVRRLLPEAVQALPGRDDSSIIYPHISLQCPGGVQIQGNDICFVTPRENRLLISRDLESMELAIAPEKFGPELKDTQVFLLGSLNQILDRQILEDRVEKVKQLFTYLPEDALVIMEDGCYVRKSFHEYVYRELIPCCDVLSMNEDELQECLGHRIRLLDPEAVMQAVQTVREKTGAPTLLVHTALWALAYGPKADLLAGALEAGVTTAATRFRIGDDLTPDACAQTRAMADIPQSVEFCRRIRQLLTEDIHIVPSKDLSAVAIPTVVGLGDTFVGGLLMGLAGSKEE